MRQGWKCAGALLAILSFAAIGTMANGVDAAPRRGSGTQSESGAAGDAAIPKPRRTPKRSHQFTGYVTAVDKASLTVERRGKNPRQMVFVKHDEMRTSGEVEKEARVTVYYRDEGGRSVAYRVIAKTATTRSRKTG